MGEEDSKLDSYDTELENGIFQLVISLCQQKAAVIGISQAKAEVGELLKSMAVGLCLEQDTHIDKE